MAYAFGWAQMQNHGDLLLRLVAQARGRASEYLNADYLDEDRWVWTLDLRADAERSLAAQPPEMRAHLNSFVAGINMVFGTLACLRSQLSPKATVVPANGGIVLSNWEI